MNIKKDKKNKKKLKEVTESPDISMDQPPTAQEFIAKMKKKKLNRKEFRGEQ